MLSVVIPVYNEADTVVRVVQRVRDTLQGCQVVVVDDGSTDGTREKLAELRQRYRDVDGFVVVLHERNRGKGAALRSGFKEATRQLVVVQDADLEYDPADIPRLMKPVLDGRADVVFGSRFAGGGAHRVLYFWHYAGNRILTLLSNMFTNLNLTDMETCYKLFRRDVLELIDLKEERFGFEPELTAKVAALHCRVYEMGISYDGRTYEQGKKIGMSDGFRAVWCTVKYNTWARAKGRYTPPAAPAPEAPAANAPHV